MGNVALGIVFNLGLIMGCSLVLVKSVDLFISSSTKLAQHMKLSGYTISFLLVAVATSFPELTVAVTSASTGNPILSYGDALGSNIALLTLMTAIPGLMGNVKRKMVNVPQASLCGKTENSPKAFGKN